LSADASSTHGLSPQFVIHYELGRIRGSRSSPFEALQSNTTALQDPLSIVISTHAVSDSDLLSVPIDDALSSDDPSTVIRLYSAPPELDPFSEHAILAANPPMIFS
jgi:hypothetical protein